MIWSTVVYIYSENKRILCEGISGGGIFKGGAGLCWNNGSKFQSMFDNKAQSSTVLDLSWLLIEILAWWGDFGQICTCGVRSNPSLRHGKETSVIFRDKFFNGKIFDVY